MRQSQVGSSKSKCIYASRGGPRTTICTREIKEVVFISIIVTTMSAHTIEGLSSCMDSQRSECCRRPGNLILIKSCNHIGTLISRSPLSTDPPISSKWELRTSSAKHSITGQVGISTNHATRAIGRVSKRPTQQELRVRCRLYVILIWTNVTGLSALPQEPL